MPNTNADPVWLVEKLHVCTGIPLRMLYRIMNRNALRRWRSKVRDKTNEMICKLPGVRRLVRYHMRGYVRAKPEKYDFSFGK